LGLADADSTENQTSSENIVISPVSCPVDDRMPGDPKLVYGQIVSALRDTKLFELMQCEKFPEEYFCNYEANSAYEARFASAGLSVAARGPNGEIRAVEIKEHRFFFATLFQPQ
jgi:CTP synthase (UTP-ammonia lyase)